VVDKVRQLKISKREEEKCRARNVRESSFELEVGLYKLRYVLDAEQYYYRVWIFVFRMKVNNK
jgi:hypothetical protein